jgi:hypothetical protein
MILSEDRYTPHADNWRADAHVAKMSSVPIMLDEPICTLPM